MVKKTIALLCIVLFIISCDFGLEDGSDLLGRWVCVDGFTYDLTFFADGTGYNNVGLSPDEYWFKWRAGESNNWYPEPIDPDKPIIGLIPRDAPYKMIYITVYTDNTFREKNEYKILSDFEYFFTDDKSKLYLSEGWYCKFHPFEKRNLLDSYE